MYSLGIKIVDIFQKKSGIERAEMYVLSLAEAPILFMRVPFVGVSATTINSGNTFLEICN